MAQFPDDFSQLFPPLAWEMPLALIAVDAAGRVRYANPAAGSLLVGPASAFVGLAWSELVRDVGFPPRLPCEASLRRQSGDAVAVRLRPCSPAPTELVAFYAEPLEFPLSLPTDTNRLRLLVDHNPDIILTVGRDLKVRECNRVAPPLTREQFIGTDITSYLDPATRAATLAMYEEVWRTGRPVDIETPVKLNNKFEWYLTRLVPLPDPDGGPDGLLMVSREITDLKLAQEALRESEARFRQIDEALEDILWITDYPGAKLVYVSRAADSIWGFPGERLRTEPTAWLDATHPDDRDRVLQSGAGIHANGADNFELEFRIFRADGALRWLHSSGVVLRNEDGSLHRMVGIVRDITARKRLEENQAVLQRQLQEARHLESLGVLAGGIAHDFNNLLSGILGNVNLAQLDAVDPSMRGYLDSIEKQSLRAGDLCKQMLAYAGKNKPRLAAVDLEALVDGVAAMAPQSNPGPFRMIVEHSGTSPAISGDAGQLRQALLNIVINAAESFGDRADRSGTIRIATGLMTLGPGVRPESLSPGESELPAGVYATIEVGDDGSGMEPAVVARVFEPFFTTKFPGRGLGLSAVHGILRNHRGAIRVASRPGEGSRFTLLLPTADVMPPVEARAVGALRGEILLVDDEDVVRKTLALMLRALGFSVRLAGNGAEALAEYRRRPGGLRAVLVDYTMPEMTGEQFVRELRRLDAKIPIVLMTGDVIDDLQHRFGDMALVGVLQKPFRMARLEAVLRSALAGN
jgi:two-component system, cell cycle sensor histidine kinase and response regulator CckA